MNALAGRVVVITGAGRGLGREHALLAAAEGASVVVNDIGADATGEGSDPTLATGVAEEITQAGGTAVASSADARTMSGASELLELALSSFGRVDGLVNNAGVLRDRMFVNMSEEDWDAVIEGHLKSTFTVSRAFSAHWRSESKEGRQPNASIVNVSSTSGLIGQIGQTNYGAAKAGIAALTVILAQEMNRYGVRVNALTPVARTRMTEDLPKIGEIMAAPSDPKAFDTYHPGNVSPLVGWLLTEHCEENGSVFYSKGGEIRKYEPWTFEWTVDKGERLTVEGVGELIKAQAEQADA